MNIDYTSFPLADTPYVAHLVPWKELSQSDKDLAFARFSGMWIGSKNMQDYVYLCAPQGGLISRRMI